MTPRDARVLKLGREHVKAHGDPFRSRLIDIRLEIARVFSDVEVGRKDDPVPRQAIREFETRSETLSLAQNALSRGLELVEALEELNRLNDPQTRKMLNELAELIGYAACPQKQPRRKRKGPLKRG